MVRPENGGLRNPLAFVSDNQVPWPQFYLEGKLDITKAWGVRGYPIVFVGRSSRPRRDHARREELEHPCCRNCSKTPLEGARDHAGKWPQADTARGEPRGRAVAPKDQPKNPGSDNPGADPARRLPRADPTSMGQARVSDLAGFLGAVLAQPVT